MMKGKIKGRKQKMEKSRKTERKVKHLKVEETGTELLEEGDVKKNLSKMQSVTLLKFGGGVITYSKSGFREKTVRRLAEEIKNSGEKVIVVHGAGSFGHILAKKYRLDKGFIHDGQVKGVAVVQRDMRDLNLKVVNCLIGAGMNPVSIPPSSVVECRNKKIEKINVDVFKKYLSLGLTPVTFGDVVLDRKLGFCICSGDMLMVELANAFRPRKAFFVVSDTDAYSKNDLILIKAVMNMKTKIPSTTRLVLVNGKIKGSLQKTLDSKGGGKNNAEHLKEHTNNFSDKRKPSHHTLFHTVLFLRDNFGMTYDEVSAKLVEMFNGLSPKMVRYQVKKIICEREGVKK